MQVEFEYEIEIVAGDYAECVPLTVVAYVQAATDHYYDASFGNYLPGDDAEIDIEQVYFEGKEITIAQAIELADEKNLVDNLEQAALDTAIKQQSW